jgi:transposase
MATIQSKTSHGCKYWYIVESRRVNGKPRPVVLAYLGSAYKLLQRLQATANNDDIKLKSYSHGAVAALLKIAIELDIPTQINRYIKSPRNYMAEKPIRNELTAGMTLLLGAIGRVCMLSSKRGWWTWARTTSCKYLLRCNLSKIDSQHFWDLMDALPVAQIPKIEQALLQRAFTLFDLNADTLLLDTTNFFTFINTANTRCTIAQRGKGKQKRNDLRQIGLALVVSREDYIPLFHLTYKGNMNDSKVFASIIEKISIRMKDLHLDINKQTIIFDRGNNSKKNLKLLASLNLYYIGALTPTHHKDLLNDAENNYAEVSLHPDETVMVYRDKRQIWAEERTVLVFVSDTLKEGQIRGIWQWITKKQLRLEKIKNSLLSPRCRKRSVQQIETIVSSLLQHAPFAQQLFQWRVEQKSDQCRATLDYHLNTELLAEVEESLGFRIIMTNRHTWDTAQIINAYYGQSFVEGAFRNIKNPYHLAVRPQYHWTDQKIEVHFFTCVIGYLLSTLAYRKARRDIGFKHSLDMMLDTLNNIRLATMLRMEKDKRKKLVATYTLEEMNEEEKQLFEALGLSDFHKRRPKINGLSVYDD